MRGKVPRSWAVFMVALAAVAGAVCGTVIDRGGDIAGREGTLTARPAPRDAPPPSTAAPVQPVATPKAPPPQPAAAGFAAMASARSGAEAARYEVFAALVAPVLPKPPTSGGDERAAIPPAWPQPPTTFHLADGTVRLGRPMSRSLDRTLVMAPDGSEVEILAEDVRTEAPADAVAWRSACTQVLSTQRRTAGSLYPPLARYQEATLAARQGLWDEAERLLDEALAGDGAAFLIGTFCTGDAQRLTARWRAAAGDEEPDAPPPATTTPRPPDGAPTAAVTADARFRKATAIEAAGLARYRQSLGETQEALAALRAARGSFERALDLLDDLARDYPLAPEVEAMRERIQVLVYDCVKRDRL